MNQKTLYLKYRPQTLDEIVGQVEIVNVLKNSIKNDNLSHAYIFSGTRGTGKTTTARAFAKEIGIHSQDILELDAASNRGIDEIKSLIESVYTLPYFSKYKMYILDEAHMLTTQAANAFLKTLEEPPAHVIFVLCTTDPEKMLETILSRCVKFNLKSPSQEILLNFLTKVCESENVTIDREAVNLVALSGNGSFRDSLSNLQKVLSYSTDEKFTEKQVSSVLGVAGTASIFEYLKSLDGIIDTKNGVDVLKNLVESGVDNKLFAKEVIYYARLIILSRHKLISEKDIKENYGEHVLDYLGDFIKNKTPKLNSGVLSKLLDAEIVSNTSSYPFLVYELLLL